MGHRDLLVTQIYLNRQAQLLRSSREASAAGRLRSNAETVEVRISTQLLPGIRYEAARGYQVSTREPWNKKQPIMISKDAAPIISFPMKNPTIRTVNPALINNAKPQIRAIGLPKRASPNVTPSTMSARTIQLHAIE